MDKLLLKLGCEDIQNTKDRFADSSDFYSEIVALALREDAFENLGEALRMQNQAAAFEAAHSLKGVFSNCGITPMLGLIKQITEPLRSGEPDYSQLSALYDKLLVQKEKAAAIIAASRGESNG